MPTFAEAVDEFLLILRAEGRSRATLQWYRTLLDRAALRWERLAIDQIARHDARQYLADLRGRAYRYQDAPNKPPQPGGLSDETIRNHIRCLRRFFAWCEVEYQLGSNPMAGVQMPRRKKQTPKAIELADLRRLLDACADTPTGRRDKALLAFLADTGTRAEGTLSLTADRLDLDRGTAIVFEKSRLRRIHFTAYTGDLITRWLAVRPASAETIFCSIGGQYEAEKMTVYGLNQMLRRLAKRAGVTGRCNPHSFRHAFARQYLLNGGELATLSALMGHSDPNTTVGFYAIFTDRELKAQHDRFSPMTNLGGDTGEDHT